MSNSRLLKSARVVVVHHNDGLRKRCDCTRRSWSKCSHDWHFSFKWGPTHWRFSLDKHLSRQLKSKDEARAEADRIRGEIRAGAFRLDNAPAPVTDPAALTFEAFAEIWLERAQRPTRDKSYVRLLCAKRFRVSELDRLGDVPIGAITEDYLEVVFTGLVQSYAASTRNQLLQVIKNMQRWGRKKGYLARPWLGPDTEIKRAKHAQRHRRLAPGEEGALIGAASAWLQRVIIAAIETGCRRGELLSLQWQDVSLTRGELVIRAEKAKTRTQRLVAVSPRLKGVLLHLRTDPTGKEHPPLNYVFGDVSGRRIGSFATAWENAVLRAHGYPVVRNRRTHGLEADSRKRFAEVDLHFHDLRHEAGSRMVEAGWPLHHVQRMLGHANISQTSTYLNAEVTGLQDSMRRFGTQPLHAVAPDVSGEFSPRSNDGGSSESKSLVN
jgi:integrase